MILIKDAINSPEDNIYSKAINAAGNFVQHNKNTVVDSFGKNILTLNYKKRNFINCKTINNKNLSSCTTYFYLLLLSSHHLHV